MNISAEKNLGTVSYSHFVATTAVGLSLAVYEIFSIKEWRDLKTELGVVQGR